MLYQGIRHVYVYYVMILTSMVSGEIQAAPSYLFMDRTAINYSQAEAACHSNNSTLPAPQTWTQHHKLTEEIKKHSLTTAWLRLIKIQRTKYTWVNNEEVQEGRINHTQLSAHKKECGTLRPQEHNLKDADCAFAGHGYICRHEGTCPASFYFYNCHYMATEDVSFTFQCGVSNWFSAQSQCEANGGELARFDSSEQVFEVLTKMKQLQGCTTFWVGFSRVSWGYQKNNATEVIKLAPWHLWEPEMNKDCCAVTRKGALYAWKAVNCSAAHFVICQTSEALTSDIPGTETESLAVSTLAGSTVMPPEGQTTSLTSTSKNLGEKTTGKTVQHLLRTCIGRISPCINMNNTSRQSSTKPAPGDDGKTNTGVGCSTDREKDYDLEEEEESFIDNIKKT